MNRLEELASAFFVMTSPVYDLTGPGPTFWKWTIITARQGQPVVESREWFPKPAAARLDGLTKLARLVATLGGEA